MYIHHGARSERRDISSRCRIVIIMEFGACTCSFSAAPVRSAPPSFANCAAWTPGPRPGAIGRLREKTCRLGATPLPGDIASPERWIGSLPQIDAMIHAASEFSAAMGEIDRRLLDVLLPALGARPNNPRFIYTGGCWLFGATGDEVATEQTPFRPLPAFAWMVPNLQRVLDAPGIDGIVIHPAMVYEPEAASSVASPRMRASAMRSAWWRVKRYAGRWCTAPTSQRSTRSRWRMRPHDRVSSGGDRRTCRRPHRACLRKTPRHAAARAADHFRRGGRRRTRRLGERACARPAAERREGSARARLAAEASGSRARNRGGMKTKRPRGVDRARSRLHQVTATRGTGSRPVAERRSNFNGGRCLERLTSVACAIGLLVLGERSRIVQDLLVGSDAIALRPKGDLANFAELPSYVLGGAGGASQACNRFLDLSGTGIHRA